MAPSSANRQLDRAQPAPRLATCSTRPAGRSAPTASGATPRARLLKVEFLNDSQTFDRVINPYVENLIRLGIDAVHVRVDNAQATNRERSYDFDMVTAQFPMDYIPGLGAEAVLRFGNLPKPRSATSWV